MPPKAEKKPTTAGKAPAGKAPAEKKEAGKKTAAPAGDKKKRTKTRKETYSSYIYKGNVYSSVHFVVFECFVWSGFARLFVLKGRMTCFSRVGSDIDLCTSSLWTLITC